MPNNKLPTISLIVRTKNEEKWIGRCLNSIYSQKVNANIEVVLVDSGSTDHTIEVAKRFSIDKVLKIKNFLPGKALNDGIRKSKGEYLVCLSAHCIPVENNWLQTLLDNFNDDKVAGVYGRQLPLSFTDPIDKRDLLITFGLDKRVQVKDHFFHNANSMIPRKIWKKYPFDEEATNIEDRIWGKEVINAGYKLIYDPEAAVYHHHGLHHGNNIERVKGVVSILEQVEERELNRLPESMMPKNIQTIAIVPVLGEISKEEIKLKYFNKTISYLKKSKLLSDIYCVSVNKDLAIKNNIKWINRKKIKNSETISLNKLIQSCLSIVEEKNIFPDNLLYVNYDYMIRPAKLIDELIIDAQYKGCDTIFPGLTDYGHYWFFNDNDYQQNDSSLRSREDRDPLFKALYGLGWLVSAWVARSGKMTSGKVGILPLSDPKFSKRLKQ